MQASVCVCEPEWCLCKLELANNNSIIIHQLASYHLEPLETLVGLFAGHQTIELAADYPQRYLYRHGWQWKLMRRNVAQNKL